MMQVEVISHQALSLKKKGILFRNAEIGAAVAMENGDEEVKRLQSI